MDAIARYFFRTGRIIDQVVSTPLFTVSLHSDSAKSALGNENQNDEVGDLIRGDLCTGIAMILQVCSNYTCMLKGKPKKCVVNQDGRAATWPFAHIWEVFDGSRLKQGNRQHEALCSRACRAHVHVCSSH